MEDTFQLRSLVQYIDLALMDKGAAPLHPGLKDKSISWDTKPKDVVALLKKAKVLLLHPDGFDKWTDILYFLSERMNLPIKLCIIAFSDYAVGDEHMESFLAFFSKTEFWIQNWCGSLPRCRLLPLGVNEQAKIYNQKTRPLGISFLLNYIGNEKREDFFHFLRTNPSIQQYCLEKGPFQEYAKGLSECFFSTCPMGEGFDTYRFWESLMVGTIPIVKDHPFYDILLEYYPNIPMLRVKQWDEILTLLPTINKTTWEKMWQGQTLICKQSYWTNEIERLRSMSDSIVPSE